ncbi:MAG: hypothetical protein M1833_001610 [Piccolia ochrophora]|nr:MAG: hypothetical protein M1833_001610 [Piccolia ochrophora]
MARIRVGIIGLSASAKTAWASQAHLPALKALHTKYTITALCNSSVAKAKSAIKTYELPQTTKAYGDPQDLADDPDVDLVVCNTRVDLHYETIRPSIEKGKDVYVEWPLCSSLKDAQELNELAKQKGVKTVIGLQTRVMPVVQKVKTLLEQGRIGKVLSCQIEAYGGTKSRNLLSSGISYFTQKKFGGNLVTIGFGHMIDYAHSVVGEFESFNANLRLLRPEVGLVRDGKVVETITSDVPDLIGMQGNLTSGIPMFVTYRRGPPFKGTMGLTWQIEGENGQIRVTSEGPSLQASKDEIFLHVEDYKTEKVEEIDWSFERGDLPPQARSVYVMYDAFAKGDQTLYPDFDDAVLRHREIDELFKSSDEGRKGKYL